MEQALSPAYRGYHPHLACRPNARAQRYATERSAPVPQLARFPGARHHQGPADRDPDAGKSDDKPAFPGQTRAPYEATAPVTVTVLTDKLSHPWSLGFLPDGKFLITEKPGTMRILDASGALSRRSLAFRP